MVKIALNKCFGGFSLSEKAYEALGLEWDKYGFEYKEEHKRTDPKLIEVIEKLGEEADGRHDRLVVVEVPDDVNWYIDDYDGVETIREHHRTW